MKFFYQVDLLVKAHGMVVIFPSKSWSVNSDCHKAAQKVKKN